MTYSLGIFFLVFVLSLYTYATVSHYFSVHVLQAFTFACISIWGIIGIILVAKLLRSINRRFFKKTLAKNTIAQKLYPLVDGIILVAIISIGGSITLGWLGINMSHLLAGFGIGGAFLALIGQNLMSNFSATLSLMFSNTIHIGETVRVRTLKGKIKEIGISSTILLDENGNKITIPNRVMVTEPIEFFK